MHVNSLLLLAVALPVMVACGGGRSPELSAAAPRAEISNDCAGTDASADGGERWLSAWGGTRTGGTAPADTTVRSVMRVTAGGSSLRLRFFNLSPDSTIEIAAASVAIRDGDTGAKLVPGTLTSVTFNCGETGVTIPAGTASLYSDAVPLAVSALDDVAVSLHVAGSGNAAEFHTEWNFSYVAANGAGDLTADESGAAFGNSMNTVYALRDVEVLTGEATGAITLLGSSSLHGSSSTQDAHLRVGEQIAARIVAEIPAGERKTIVHRGIGGDTLANAWATRMEQDIWSTQGVDGVVVWVTNDLATRSADEIIADYLALIEAAHERGINVYCPTWVPGAQSAAANVNGDRDALNDWILSSGNCDVVVDWGSMVEDPVLGITYHPDYLADGIHTNDAGHTLWADETPVVDWVSLPPPGAE